MTMYLFFLSSLFILSSITVTQAYYSERSFGIDYEHDTFVKDGRPFRYISGSVHYMRILPEYWEDRLRKMHAAGLDAIQVYVAWNIHQPEVNEFSFSGQADIVRFLLLAREIGLLVILRPGPYICAEWDYGGFPYWLKDGNQSMVLRSMDPGYIRAVTNYFSVLLPKMKPLLYSNGGPIIMIQVENEYGSYRGVTCDHQYMAYLRDMMFGILGKDVLLFTTDGNGKDYLKCGAIDGVYATVDFGPSNATASFAPMREWNPKGPLVNSEYYIGWLDYWHGNWSRTPTNVAISTLKQMLDMGASVNMYTFEGGSNFGYSNGADPPYVPVTTSYDFDGALSEAGDTTQKYTAIRYLLSQYKSVPQHIPRNITKENYGQVNMKLLSSVVSALDDLSPEGYISTRYPITMERARQAYGFALYHHKLGFTVRDAMLDLSGVRDRAYVIINTTYVGLVYRNNLPMSLNISATVGQDLYIIVENMGRINYGGQINDNFKGVTSNISLSGEILTGWDYYNLDLNQAFTLAQSIHSYSIPPLSHLPGPSLYTGSFILHEDQVPADTFLNVCGWGKGQALINGFNIGRYWPVAGPQVTLYLPGVHIKPHPYTNILVLLELEQTPTSCQGHPVKGHPVKGQGHLVKGQGSQDKITDDDTLWNKVKVVGRRDELDNLGLWKHKTDFLDKLKSYYQVSKVKGQECTVTLQDKPILGGRCTSVDHIDAAINADVDEERTPDLRATLQFP